MSVDAALSRLSFGGFDPNPTLGALLIGVLLSVFLFGIVTVQTYLYFEKFEDDSWMFKVLVSAVWVLDLAHTICVSHSVYSSTITLYGHPEKLVQFQSLSAAVFFGGLITTLTQGFFSIRIHKILGTPYIAYLCYLLVLARLVGSVSISIEAFLSKSITQYQIDWGWLLTTLLVVGAVLDVIVAGSMCFYVARHKRNAGNDGSQRVLDRLMAWTVQTGLTTSVSAVALVICFQVMPKNFVWITIYTFLAKLYSNSLLASLNARSKLRQLYPVTASNEITTGRSYQEQMSDERPMSRQFGPVPGLQALSVEIPMSTHNNRLPPHRSPVGAYRSPMMDKKRYQWEEDTDIGLAR